ncbi:MAG: sulfurtransferase [Sphingomonas fennica]
MDLLVTTDELAARAGEPGLVVVDCTYHSLEPDRDAAAEHAEGHVPGAVFLDLKGLEPDAPDLFAARATAIGLSAAREIVLYDAATHRTAARGWWLLRYFGIDTPIRLLDGGFAAWGEDGRPIETGGPAAPGGPPVTPRPQPALLVDKPAVLGGVPQLVDARSAARFTGAEADPRPQMARGHIPGSVNLPYNRLLAADGRWRSPEAIRAAFAEVGVDVDRPVTTTCGSGVTASVLLFGQALAGGAKGALYNGSWREWGIDPATPKAVTA